MINKQVKCHTSRLVCTESKNSRLVESKTAKLKNDILDIQYMCNFFYNFCSTGMYPFTPTYTRISLPMLEMRAGRQSFIYLRLTSPTAECVDKF
jgi:hypothetical protein